MRRYSYKCTSACFVWVWALFLLSTSTLLETVDAQRAIVNLGKRLQDKNPFNRSRKKKQSTGEESNYQYEEDETGSGSSGAAWWWDADSPSTTVVMVSCLIAIGCVVAGVTSRRPDMDGEL